MDQRKQVAEEAARLLYNSGVKEYKDAKEMAASNLGAKILPSNYEVAVELDKLAALMEGSERNNRLLAMRETALKVMKTIESYGPKLIGSVWRGTARRGSDIDIMVYHSDPSFIAREVSDVSDVKDMDDETYYIEGIPHQTTHLIMNVCDFDLEIVVKPPEEQIKERCEIYGDLKVGVGVNELEKLMKSDPLRRFVPKRRQR